MNPRSFDYHAPTSVKEAVALLEEHRGDAKLLAGGQSLIPLMKLRIASPAHLIDLGGVGGLEYVKREGGQIAIGAMTRMAEIEGSELLKKSCTILSECASQIADPLVRNMATIGGNISHADPANDIPAVMLATNAELVATGPKGRRAIPASEFFVDTFTTALAEDEVLTEIRIPVSRFTGGAYAKLERQTGDFAIVAVAANLHLSAEGRCKECGDRPHQRGTHSDQSEEVRGRTGGHQGRRCSRREGVCAGLGRLEPRRGPERFRTLQERDGEGSRKESDFPGPEESEEQIAVKVPITVEVNGAKREARVEPRTLLAHFLRDDLGLTGTHVACDTTNCGACAVLLDGKPVKSCTIFAVQANGRKVTTIEGIGSADSSTRSSSRSGTSTDFSAGSAPRE